MSNSSDPNDRAGWERIFRSGDIHPRYRTLAAPNDSIVAWAATLPAGAAILDVGCGVGRHTVYLGERGFRMAGVDISPTGVKMTGEACAERAIEFDGRVSPMTVLPWDDALFDAALSTSTITHNLRANIFKSLAEVRRVLKPGGVFIVDFIDVDRGNVPELRRQVAAGEILEPEPNTFIDERPDSEDLDGFLPHHYSDEAEVRDLMREFEIIDLSRGAGSERGRWVVTARRPLTD